MYHGYWEYGQRHGEGVIQYTNKDVYSGFRVRGYKEEKELSFSSRRAKSTWVAGAEARWSKASEAIETEPGSREISTSKSLLVLDHGSESTETRSK